MVRMPLLLHIFALITYTEKTYIRWYRFCKRQGRFGRKKTSIGKSWESWDFNDKSFKFFHLPVSDL